MCSTWLWIALSLGLISVVGVTGAASVRSITGAAE